MTIVSFIAGYWSLLRVEARTARSQKALSCAWMIRPVRSCFRSMIIQWSLLRVYVDGINGQRQY